MVEKNQEFCAACISRKALRSKHCSICNRCVSKMDHHCPWLGNCIGEKNVKYFVGFCITIPPLTAIYLHGVTMCNV